MLRRGGGPPGLARMRSRSRHLQPPGGFGGSLTRQAGGYLPGHSAATEGSSLPA